MAPQYAISHALQTVASVRLASTPAVVGVLLVFALLIVPAATAELVSYRPLTTILLAIGISLFSTWAGLAASSLRRLTGSRAVLATNLKVFRSSILAIRSRQT